MQAVRAPESVAALCVTCRAPHGIADTRGHFIGRNGPCGSPDSRRMPGRVGRSGRVRGKAVAEGWESPRPRRCADAAEWRAHTPCAPAQARKRVCRTAGNKGARRRLKCPGSHGAWQAKSPPTHDLPSSSTLCGRPQRRIAKTRGRQRRLKDLPYEPDAPLCEWARCAAAAIKQDMIFLSMPAPRLD